MSHKKHKQTNIETVEKPAIVKDTSPKIFQRDKLKNELHIYQRELTDKQKLFIEKALDKKTKAIFCEGGAGTSKTFLSVYCALTLLNQKKVSDLIYVRAAVESADSKLGFLPGELDDKIAPYLQPLLDKLEELLPQNEIAMLQKDNRISSIPISFMRGLNWNAKAIILDEAQSTTIEELITIITRVGEFSKIFFIGDSDQSDIKNKSGFKKMISLFKDQESIDNGIVTFEFTEDDCVRSAFCKFVLKKLKDLKKG